jgi:hypothetical protein
LGQLAGAAHRLLFVREELEACTSDPNIETVLMRLEYHMENYLVRIYELRERTVSLAAVIIGDVQIARLLKSKRQRSTALRMIQNYGSALSQSLETLLARLDSDIALRNRHTHDTFLSIVICVDNDIYDPADALMDLGHDPDARLELVRLSSDRGTAAGR